VQCISFCCIVDAEQQLNSDVVPERYVSTVRLHVFLHILIVHSKVLVMAADVFRIDIVLHADDWYRFFINICIINSVAMNGLLIVIG